MEQSNGAEPDTGLGHTREDFLKGVADVLLWRRPGLTLLMLMSANLVYYHLIFRYLGLVPLIADVLLVLACAAGVLKVLAKQFDISIQDIPAYEVSESTSECIIASVVNTVGAAEGVLRGAANGQDWKLFLKVCFTLYCASVLGRVFSGATVLFVGVWLLFLLPPLYGLFPIPGLLKGTESPEQTETDRFESMGEVLLPALSRITTPRPSLQ